MNQASSRSPVAGRFDPPRRRLMAKGAATVLGGLMLRHGLWGTPATAAASGADSDAPWQNWSGSQTARPAAFPIPADEAALQGVMAAGTGEIRALGAGHSFSPLVPTPGAIVSLDRLAGLVGIDRKAMTVTMQAGTRLGVLARALDEQGLALRNLPDIDAQSVAGAISTATHGTGAALPALHADVAGLRIVTPGGKVVELHEDNGGKDREQLDAARVALGSFGVITRITMRVLPAYNLHRKVWLMPIDRLLNQAPELARRHRHFEFYYLPFTGYGAAISHDLYTGRDLLAPRSDDEAFLDDLRRLRDWLGRFPQLRLWVAQKMIDPNQTEEARHRAHRLLSTTRPMRFNESEWHVPRARGIACLREVIRVLERRDDVFFPVEFRFIQGDGAWLSPFHGGDRCAIAVHAAEGEPWDYLVKDCSPVFRAHQGRPHWGKLHDLRAVDAAAMYPRWRDFQAMRRQFDPQGRMLNAHLRQLFA